MRTERDRELEELFGISYERIVEIDELACQGIPPGEPAGPVIYFGRPPLYDETMVTVSFKAPPQKIAELDQRAKSLGMGRSQYLRALIDRDLASEPPTTE